MGKPIRNIIAILIIALPFYLAAIAQKLWGTVDYSVHTIFGEYLLFTAIGILVVFLLNKYLLKNSCKIFVASEGTLLLDVSMAFLLLVITYFIISLGNITYGRWIETNVDRSQVINMLNEIFSNRFYTIVLLGPLIWITETFLALSRAFLLNNLWELSESKIWIWASVFAIALLASLVQIDNGWPAVINWFLIFSTSNILYLKYRRIFPLMIAGILLQSIDLISYWVYVFE